MQYDCEKKLEFIKKGMGELTFLRDVLKIDSSLIADKYRTKSKALENFPADVVKAEKLTKGNVNILSSLETPTKQKQPVVSPEKASIEASPASTSKKPTGAYNSSSKVQISASPAPKPDKVFSCSMCDYSTDRMNLLMFHYKNHSLTITPRVSGKFRLPNLIRRVQKPFPIRRSFAAL